jgi:MFS family permease
MLNHPLIRSLRNFTGNARACVYTEPLWGIPYNLFTPFLSVYMLAYGLTDSQIGMVTSIGLAFQIVFSLLGGPITDKFGRRKVNFFFDFFAWAMPCIIWAFSHNFWGFMIGMIFNSLWRISNVAWPLLLAEDTDPRLLVEIYTWIYIFSTSVSLVTPLAGLLIDKISLIPAMRLIFLGSAVVFVVKFIILFRSAHETTQGKIRVEQTRGQSIFHLLGGYRAVLAQMLRTRETMFTVGIVIINTVCSMIYNTFWSIYVTQKLDIPPQLMSIYPFARAVFVLIFFFSIQPLINRFHFRIPMLAAYAGFILSQVVLILLPQHNYILLFVSVFLEAWSFACLNPQIDRLMVVTVDAHERARIVSLIGVSALLVSTPFGWISGLLSQWNRTLPFILSAILYGMGALATYVFTRRLPEVADAAE